MRYFIEISKQAENDISKIKNRVLQSNIKNKIRQLKTYPKKGKHLFKNVYELKAKNYRVYYELFRGIIVIEKVTYSGKATITKVGTKNRQKKDVVGL